MVEKTRFAPLIRVSTEAQEKRGESLHIQTEKIKEAVKGMRGTIVSWDYAAHEHSTPDAERRILHMPSLVLQSEKMQIVITCIPGLQANARSIAITFPTARRSLLRMR